MKLIGLILVQQGLLLLMLSGKLTKAEPIPIRPNTDLIEALQSNFTSPPAEEPLKNNIPARSFADFLIKLVNASSPYINNFGSEVVDKTKKFMGYEVDVGVNTTTPVIVINKTMIHLAEALNRTLELRVEILENRNRISDNKELILGTNHSLFVKMGEVQEGVDDLGHKVDGLETKIDNLSQNFDGIETNMNNLTIHLYKMDRNMSKFRLKMDSHFKEMNSHFKEMNSHFNEMNSTLQWIVNKLNKTTNHDEQKDQVSVGNNKSEEKVQNNKILRKYSN